MSLTSFLKIPEVKDRFKKEFPLKRQKIKGEIFAPTMTKNYGLVGTAFDYLIRFYIHRNSENVYENNSWVAELGLESLNRLSKLGQKINPKTEREELRKKRLTRLGKRYSKLFFDGKKNFHSAKKHYEKYMSDGDIKKSLIKSSIRLAQLDTFYRILYMPKTSRFPRIDDGDIKDLESLFKIIPQEVFSTDNTCILNPTFGDASELVGGADADLIIGDTLIDVKTTKYLSFRSEYYFQLIGYYILSCIGGIDGFYRGHTINRIAVYFSRFGILHTIDLDEVKKNSNFDEYVQWFSLKAKEYF